MCTGNMPLVPRLVGVKKREGESKDIDSCEKNIKGSKWKLQLQDIDTGLEVCIKQEFLLMDACYDVQMCISSIENVIIYL